MDTRKRLYKATSNTLTLTERVKKDRSRQNVTRNNRFNANRNLHLDDSLSTPTKAVPIKLSQIKDKPAKLKAYIEQKRTNKLKEQIEQRSPFIPFVPVGRWVEKKETVKKPKAFTISTPVRKALMSDGKILKKSTIKEIATTARKENIGTIKRSKQNEPVKSRKKILIELNNVPHNKPIEEPQKVISIQESPEQLNETFELISSEDENKPANTSVEKIKTPEKSSSFIIETLHKNESPAVVKAPVIVKPVVPKKLAKPENASTNRMPLRQKKEGPKKPVAKILVPVKRSVRVKVTEKKPVERAVSKKAEKVSKTKKMVIKSKSAPVASTPISKKTQEVVPQKKAVSKTYQLYKGFLENQERYISIQLKNFTSNMDSFIDKIPEEIQSSVHQTIQQGNALINEKFKSFDEFLESFEQGDKSDPKSKREDDVENYWILLYEQIAKFKENLCCAQEAKTMATRDEKKRRTRKTLTETPSRRSRRIAESGDTPKHNSSTCFGCTPMSASKVNTPKSAKKRRETFKKSIAFDLTSER